MAHDHSHLKKYGFVPGNYLITCAFCDTAVYHLGEYDEGIDIYGGYDKRATCCYTCAVFQYEHDRLIKGE